MRKLSRLVASVLVLFMVFSTAPTWAIAASPEEGWCSKWSTPAECIIANTASGAAMGAATGALSGLAFGKKKEAVATGAVAGGVAGGLLAFATAWGKCFACFTKVKSEPTKDYAATQKETGYSPQQGVIAKLNHNQFSLTPPTAAPGDTIKLAGSYYVMFPPDRKEISVTEAVILKVYDDKTKQVEEKGKSGETVVVSPGSRKAGSEVFIPSNAVEGKYIIAFMINVEGKSDIVEMDLIVKKK